MNEERCYVQVRNVTYTYQGSNEPALKNLSFNVKKGEIVLITGPSGAGKTTICRLINGLIPHFFNGKFEGEVITKGYNTKIYDPGFFSGFIGFLFQDPSSQLVTPTVKEELAFGPENLGVPREEIIKRIKEVSFSTGLEGYERRNPHFLSYGEQQAVALASILTMQPEIFVLDEPTSNLDPAGKKRILNLINKMVKERKGTLVIVEHRLEEIAPLADKILVIHGGKLKREGKPCEVLNDVEEMLQYSVKVPQVTILIHKLKKENLITEEKLPLTVDAAYKLIKEELKKKEVVPEKILARKETWLKHLLKERSDLKETSRKKVVTIENLSFTYPKGVEALKNINLEIREGEFIGLIGQNGSGKTTLAKLINGLLKPTKGKVYVDGVDTTKTTVSFLSTKVGYVFQNPNNQLLSRTVKEELALGPRNLGLKEGEINERVNEVVEALKLKPLLNKNPFYLSRGEKQKVAVASVLTMKPKILIVDEPTTGQDYLTSLKMMNLYKKLNKEGKTIIVITHETSLVAEYCQRVILLNRGEVMLDNEPRKVFANSFLLKKVSIEPPQISQLFNLFTQNKLKWTILNTEEGFEFFKTLLTI